MVAALAGILALAGCSPSERSDPIDPEESAVDFEQSRTELLTLLDDAQAVIGGEWEPVEYGARECTTGSNGPGAHMVTDRLGPGVVDGTQRGTAEQLAEVFAAAGYELDLADSTTDDGSLVIIGRYPADGLDENGMGLEFGVGARGTTLSGTSRCVPGDPNQINQERQERDG